MHPRRSRLPACHPIVVAAVALALAGCGGGGGSSPAPAPSGGSSLTADTQGIPAFAPGAAPGSLPHVASISSTPTTPPATGTSLNPVSCYYHYSLTGSSLLAGADPLQAQQWHLQNVGQSGGTVGEDIRALAAWTQAPGLGLGARVSVVDDAVEIVHDDLSPNVVDGASHNYRSDGLEPYPLPCDNGDEHGTAVAGIAAARNGNALGGSGVAPRASLAAFNALATNYDTDIADALLRDQAVSGVYNNSWGSSDDARLHPVDATLKTAVNDGLANGRNGLGSVYVFPGGNGGCYGGASIDSNDNCLGYSDNSNFDGYVNRYGVITACAVTDRGRKPWYGEPGANLLVCGTSSNLSGNVVTTTVQNTFRTDFSGTSATAPMVSGAVALMLSVRPELSYRDVALILAHTARQNDPTDSGWVTANGLHFNHKYGFGVVDASAAVQAAKTWTSVGGFGQVRYCGWYRKSVEQALPDATSGNTTPVADAITVPADCPITKIEFVEIALTATHSYSGDLRVRLTSPGGLVSELANERVCVKMDQYGTVDTGTNGRPITVSCGNYDANWVFGSTRHLDESAAGNWTLRVTDMLASDTGTWNNWSIRFWGRP